MLSSPRLRVVGVVVLAVLPTALAAADLNGTAMLYSHGATILNGKAVPSSSTVFPGDLVQTDEHSVANISASGSLMLVDKASLVEYLGSAITLKQGAVRVSTLGLFVVRAGDISVSPADQIPSNFDIINVNGRVEIAARRGSLLITDSTGTTRLAEGQETSRDDSQPQTAKENKKKRKPAAAGGGTFNSPIAIGIATAAVVGVAAWVFVQGDEPVSPVK